MKKIILLCKIINIKLRRFTLKDKYNLSKINKIKLVKLVKLAESV